MQTNKNIYIIVEEMMMHKWTRLVGKCHKKDLVPIYEEENLTYHEVSPYGQHGGTHKKEFRKKGRTTRAKGAIQKGKTT